MTQCSNDLNTKIHVFENFETVKCCIFQPFYFLLEMLEKVQNFTIGENFKMYMKDIVNCNTCTKGRVYSCLQELYL